MRNPSGSFLRAFSGELTSKRRSPVTVQVIFDSYPQCKMIIRIFFLFDLGMGGFASYARNIFWRREQEGFCRGKVFLFAS